MNKYKLLMTILVVLLVVLGGSIFWLCGGASVLGFASADKYTSGNTEITDSVENLEIEWTAGKVCIEYHAGSGVTVSETSPRQLSEDEKLRWWMDGKTLRIQYVKPGLQLHANLQKTLTVSLPEGTVLKKAVIGATSADLDVPMLAADEIVFDTTSGDVNAVTDTKKLTASSTSGDINIRQDSDLDTVVLSSTSGSMAFTGQSVNELSGKSTSGGIGVTLSGSVGNIRMDSTSGTLCADLVNADKAEFSATSGSITVSALTFRDLLIDATSGDVTLKLPEAPGFTLELDARPSRLSSGLAMEKNGNLYICGDGSAHCKISTTSGDIRIVK